MRDKRVEIRSFGVVYLLSTVYSRDIWILVNCCLSTAGLQFCYLAMQAVSCLHYCFLKANTNPAPQKHYSVNAFQTFWLVPIQNGAVGTLCEQYKQRVKHCQNASFHFKCSARTQFSFSEKQNSILNVFFFLSSYCL